MKGALLRFTSVPGFSLLVVAYLTPLTGALHMHFIHISPDSIFPIGRMPISGNDIPIMDTAINLSK